MKKYKNITSWQNAMRKDTKKKLYTDWYVIDGDLYTLEEYDESGKYMRYTSVTAWLHIDVETSNRYSTSWLSDMVATAYPIEDLCFDITYYLSEDMTKSQLLCLVTRLKDNKMDDQIRHLADYVIQNHYKPNPIKI